MAIKNVTPPKGTKTPTQTKRAEAAEYQPRFRGDQPQRRTANPGRGNERMANDDVASGPAEHKLTPEAQANKWARIPGAITYLQQYVDDIKARDPATVAHVVAGLIECLRKFVAHLEEQGRNENKRLTPTDVIRLMDKLNDFKDQIGTLVKSPAEKVYDILRFTVVPEVFADNDITSLTVEGIGRVNIIDDMSVGMVGEDKREKDANKELFTKWLVANGLEDMITQTINAQTLAAFVRRTLKDRESKLKLPMELLDLKPVTRAQITR